MIEELWGEAAPATVNAVLNVYLSRLRRLLADGDGDEVLATQAPGYVLRVPAERLDAHRFEALLKRGREALALGNAQQAAADLRAALSLWRGPPLADLAYEQFAQSEIRRLEELRLAAIEERIETDLALGRHDGVVAELESLVAQNPYRERLRAQLMVALYRCGRQAEALDAYRRARQTFADELGIDPSPSLAKLERAILRQAASLEAPHPMHVEPVKRREPRWRVSLAAAFVLAFAIAAGLVAVLRDTSQTPPKSVVLRGNSVAVIDPATNSIVAEVPVGGRPSGIAVGARSIWVGNRDDNTLLRIDPRSREIIRRIGLPVEPGELAFAGQSVWVASRAGDAVLRVDPAVNEDVDWIPLEQGKEACCWLDLATGGGALWISQRGRLSRIDAVTHTVETPRAAGVKLVAYGHGALWVMTATGGIERIDPNTNTVLDSISLERIGQIDWGGAALAVGAGAVWTGSATLTETLWKLDPATGHITGRVRLGRPPIGIAFGEEAVWVVGNDGTLLHMDPTSETVVRPIRLGVYAAQVNTSAPIAVGRGAVWLPVTR